MEVDVDRFKFLLSKDIIYFLERHDPEFLSQNIFGIYLYLRVISEYKPIIKTQNVYLGKIPHIKLLRACSYIKNDNGYGPRIGLKMAKEFVEYLIENKYLSETSNDLDEPSCIPLTDEGENILNEIKSCISLPENEEVIWLKTKLLENFLEYRDSYNTINEKFVKTYLDFVYYGGAHV